MFVLYIAPRDICYFSFNIIHQICFGKFPLSTDSPCFLLIRHNSILLKLNQIRSLILCL